MPDLDLPRLDFNEAITLASSITSGATTVPITPNDALPTSGIFPIDIMVGGERITAAGATVDGAHLDLTSCTRSVNGVTKAHASGATVTLAHPFRLTLIATRP